jgi:hypothetical protein
MTNEMKKSDRVSTVQRSKSKVKFDDVQVNYGSDQR